MPPKSLLTHLQNPQHTPHLLQPHRIGLAPTILQTASRQFLPFVPPNSLFPNSLPRNPPFPPPAIAAYPSPPTSLNDRGMPSPRKNTSSKAPRSQPERFQCAKSRVFQLGSWSGRFEFEVEFIVGCESESEPGFASRSESVGPGDETFAAGLGASPSSP